MVLTQRTGGLEEMKKRIFLGVLMVMLSATMMMGCSFSISTRNGIKVNGNSKGDVQRYDIDEIESISKDALEGLSVIDIDSEVADIKIIPEDRDDVEIKFDGYIKTNKESNKHKLTVETKDETIYIKTGKTTKKIISSSWNNGASFNLTVKIPKTFLETLKIKLAVGDVSVSGLELKKLNIKSAVGDVKVSKITSEYVDISTDVGDLKISLDEVIGAIKLDSDTGDVEITIPEDADINISAESDVGSIKSFISGVSDKGVTGDKLNKKVGEGTHKVSVTSDVGSIYIKKLEK